MKWAREMTDAEIAAEIEQLNAQWDEMLAAPEEDVAHGGSPFEWLDERLGELQHEAKARLHAKEEQRVMGERKGVEPDFWEKTAINIEYGRLYDEGMRSGRHGHSETMFVAMHQAYAKWLRGDLPPYSPLDAERMLRP